MKAGPLSVGTSGPGVWSSLPHYFHAAKNLDYGFVFLVQIIQFIQNGFLLGTLFFCHLDEDGFVGPIKINLLEILCVPTVRNLSGIHSISSASKASVDVLVHFSLTLLSILSTSALIFGVNFPWNLAAASLASNSALVCFNGKRPCRGF